MQLKIYKTMEGLNGTLHDRLETIGMAGFDGVESELPDFPLREFKDLLEEQRLEFAVQINIDDPLKLEGDLDELLPLRPARFVCRAGRDTLTLQEGSEFFSQVLRLQSRLGIQLGFVTVRGSLLGSPWSAGAYLERFPELRLTADFSHWVLSCGRLPEDLDSLLDEACRRSIHIHGRVGHEHHIQAADPAAPEFARHLQWFEHHWDAIRVAHQERQAATLTFNPDYAPPPFMPALPYTQAAVNDPWRICRWGAERIRARWTELLEPEHGEE